MMILGLQFLDFSELIDDMITRALVHLLSELVYQVPGVHLQCREGSASLLVSEENEGLNDIVFTQNELRQPNT